MPTFLYFLLLCLGPGTLIGQRHCPVGIGESTLPDVPAFFENIHHTLTPILRNADPIPVVFHVVWYEEQENLSDERLLSQIDALNRDFAGQNENLRTEARRFRDVSADTGIRFCLANTNPDGQTQPGIVRVQTSDPEIAMRFDNGGRRLIHYTSLGGSDAWDPERYINIWISPFGNLLGMTWLPGQAPFPEEDGIIMDPDVIGTIDLQEGAEPYHRGHSLTHEMGHYLGLLHIWGPGNGSCETDDGIADTPDQALPYFGCPTPPQSSCGSEDYFMNFMDFTDDRCLAFFTQGQADHMLAVLSGMRSGLLESGASCPDHASQAGIALGEIINVRFDRNAQRLIVRTDPISMEEISIAFFSMDGKCILRDVFSYQYMFWLPSGQILPGVYVVYFTRENENYVTQIPIY